MQAVGQHYFSNKLAEVACLKAQGRPILSLAVGQPDLPPAESIVQVMTNALNRCDVHAYQPSSCIPALKEAMADYYAKTYGVLIDAQTEVLPLMGSKEGIFYTTLAMVDPAQKILIPNPGYPTYTAIANLLGAEVVYYDLKPENDWQPDWNQLHEIGLEDIKLFWTNYPHMPTGAGAKKQTYEELIRLARKHEMIIVNDNPYSRILHDDPFSVFQISGAKDYCIELNSMSKSHNIPGWRVGMCIANSDFIRWIAQAKSNVDNGMFKAIQTAAAAALTQTDDHWHRYHNILVYEKRRKLGEAILQKLGCEYDKSQRGMFLWARVASHVSDGDSLCEQLLQDFDIFIVPGSIFGSNGKKYVRLSLCASDDTLRQALDRLQKYK